MKASSDFDVIVVGSGMAGSLTAYSLARAGVRVLILEGGPPMGRRQEHINKFYAAADKTPESAWPNEPASPHPTVLDIVKPDWKDPAEYYLHQQGPLAFGSSYERVSGGTANHWVGSTPRFVPADFELLDKYGVGLNWPIGYQELEPWYFDAEREIGVSGNHGEWDGYLGAARTSGPYPMPEIPQTYADKYISRKVDGAVIHGTRVKVKPIPQARNSVFLYDGRPRCMGNTSCTPICPIQAKYDPSIHLRKALKQEMPPVVLFQCVAHRLEVSAGSNRISRVHFRRWKRNDAVIEWEDSSASARVVVVAAHAVESAKLLLNSPWKDNGVSVANSSDQVGRNLMDHVVCLRWALTNEPVYTFRGPLSTSSIDGFRDGPERKKRAAFRIDIGNDGAAWPDGAPYTTAWDFVELRRLHGKALRAALHDHLVKQLRLSAEFEMLPEPANRLTLSPELRDALGIPRPVINFNLSDYTKRGFVDATQILTSLLEQIGVQPGHERLNRPNPGSSTYFEFDNQGFEYRGAGHIIGTYRMGSDPATSVVDMNCRSHDHDNLYLLGSGVFPTSATANPTITIAALALRAANTIAKNC